MRGGSCAGARSDGATQQGGPNIPPLHWHSAVGHCGWAPTLPCETRRGTSGPTEPLRVDPSSWWPRPARRCQGVLRRVAAGARTNQTAPPPRFGTWRSSSASDRRSRSAAGSEHVARRNWWLSLSPSISVNICCRSTGSSAACSAPGGGPAASGSGQAWQPRNSATSRAPRSKLGSVESSEASRRSSSACRT